MEFPPPTPESMALMHETRYKIARAWREFLTTYPLIVAPVWTQPPFALGYDIQDAESAMKVIEGVSLRVARQPVGPARRLRRHRCRRRPADRRAGHG